MKSSTTLDIVKLVVSQMFGEPVNDNTDIYDVFGADGLDLLNLMLELETEFDIEFDDCNSIMHVLSKRPIDIAEYIDSILDKSPIKGESS